MIKAVFKQIDNHSSEIMYYLGTLPITSISQQTRHLCNIQAGAGTGQQTEDLYIRSALGHATKNQISPTKVYRLDIIASHTGAVLSCLYGNDTGYIYIMVRCSSNSRRILQLGYRARLSTAHSFSC